MSLFPAQSSLNTSHTASDIQPSPDIHSGILTAYPFNLLSSPRLNLNYPMLVIYICKNNHLLQPHDYPHRVHNTFLILHAVSFPTKYLSPCHYGSYRLSSLSPRQKPDCLYVQLVLFADFFF